MGARLASPFEAPRSPALPTLLPPTAPGVQPRLPERSPAAPPPSRRVHPSPPSAGPPRPPAAASPFDGQETTGWLRRELALGPEFEHVHRLDGFELLPGPDPLLPPFLGVASRSLVAAAADSRVGGLGWTDGLELSSDRAVGRWGIEARWAPAFLSAAPATVGLAGAIVADAADAAAVASPRSAWRAGGTLGGPLAGGRLGLSLSVDAEALVRPPVEPGLATGGFARQTLALSGEWEAGADDTVRLTLMARRQHETPACFRCTEMAARQDDGLGALLGLRWRHRWGERSALELRAGVEHRREAAEAVQPGDGLSHLDLTSWKTDGAPGALGVDDPESRLASSLTRLSLGGATILELGGHSLQLGLEGMLDRLARSAWVPGSLRFLDRGELCTDGSGAGCAFRLQLDRQDLDASAWTLAGYAQDEALLAPGLRLRAGLRLELGQGAAEGWGTGLRLGIGPRLALAWDLGTEGRQWLVAHAGRSHDSQLLDVARHGHAPAERLATWDARAGRFADCTVPSPACPWRGGTAAISPGGLSHVDEASVGWQGQFLPSAQLGAEATWRRAANLWAEREVNLLTGSDGSWLAPVDGVWHSRRVLAADPRAWRRSLSLAAWLRAHPGPLEVTAGWRLARTEGTAAAPFDDWLVDPRFAAFVQGSLPDDHRHLLLLGVRIAPHPALELGARLRYRTGAPLWETFSIRDSEGRRMVQTPRGQGFLGERTVALRDPDVATVDVQLRVRLGRALSLGFPRLDLVLDAVHAAGGNAPVHLSASAARLGAVLRREAPFHLALGLRAGN